MAAVLAAACACATAPVPEPAAVEVPPAREMVVLLPEADGSVGALTVSREGREVTLTEPYTAVVVRGPADELSDPETLDPAQVEADFGTALGALPSPPAHFILYFDRGTAELTAASRALLAQVVAAVGSRGARDVSVIGHADASGTETINVPLSRKRAEVVAEALVSLGIDRATLEIGSHGSRNPLIPGVGAEPRNRRVEVTVR